MAESRSGEHLRIARRTFEIEERALRLTRESLDEKSFAEACEMLIACTGRVVVTGMGKSGHVARKIASTLASTGTPALFLHPTEAAHGDMGMLKQLDVLIMLSKSGESEELFAILPTIASIKVPIIAITAERDSKLAKAAIDSGGVVLTIAIEEEACPLDLAPTASTTASLALGDALAMAMLEARKFSPEDFARLHPAGALGRRLTVRVKDLMMTADAIPAVAANADLATIMMEMSAKRLGATTVKGSDGRLEGIITDGDLRRHFQSSATNGSREISAKEIMTREPRTVSAEVLAIDALHMMEAGPKKVMVLVVVDERGRATGIVHLHDIVRAGIS